jgi:hypothetical protein
MLSRLTRIFRQSSSLSVHKGSAYNNENTPFEFTDSNYAEIDKIMVTAR